MFVKESYKAAGIELNVYNLLADYTLPDGRRAHNVFQVLGYGVKVNDEELIAQVKHQISRGSQICMITEIKGDFELSELSKLAETAMLLLTDNRIVYLDRELAKEYVDEVKRGDFS